MSNKAPSIASPKGGGAQAGLGEKFSPDLFTGTGNFSVPIALPPGRNGFQPELTIGYSTGSGNSVFGLGWNLGIPGIMRKTSRGIPVYDDEQDVFILSGAEDLVKVKQSNDGSRIKTYYRPRTEGLYARIVHHKLSTGANYWEVRSKDGLISFYGNPDETANHSCVIANPTIRNSIFAWKLYKTIDPFGNHIKYNYTRELVTNGKRIYDQLYVSHIEYGDYVDASITKYLLRVQFNYENRPDAFSEYKQGFEIRTTQRCTSIEMYSQPQTADLPEGYTTSNAYYTPWACNRVKIKTYDFFYIDEDNTLIQPINGVSMLHSVKVSGHDLNDSPNTEYMPPLTFDYSKFNPQKRDFYPIKGNDLPSAGLNSADIELVDLTGNGLPDILEMNGTVRWWRNKGNGEFDLPRFMQDAPSGFALADPNVQMIDANGDGRADLLINKPGLAGYYSTRFGGTWDKQSFKKYDYAPSFSFEDPEVKMMDLDGDGVTDVLRNGSRFECFYNHPQKGFYKTGVVNKKDIEDFPNVSFADPRIKTAEMEGDGLQDLVYVASGNISYWPNMGYGRFGKKMTMQNSPRFPYGFDPKRVLLGDIDGDGLADLIYVENNKVTIWINKSGNAWSEPVEITGTPAVNDMDSVRIADILGSGVSGILFSSVNNNMGKVQLYFLDFTAGNKPYLLQEMDNKMGSITRVAYTSSIDYFLADDKLPATRWKTELPFPVLVVSKVEVIDELSKGKLVTEYTYHHGYWDGAEREFRGFGRVDQRDTETFARYNNSNLVGLMQNAAGSSNQSTTYLPTSNEHYTPPTETRTWFHQGPMGDEFGEWYENDYTHEYWEGDAPKLKRSDLVSNEDINKYNALPRRAKRDALRTLRGTVLRTELYALDGSVLQSKPYTVTESISFVKENFKPSNPVADIFKYSSGYIFFPYQIAQRTTQWERGKDPMSSYSFSWEYDAYGQAQKQMSAAIARGINPLTGAAFASGSGLFVPLAISDKKYLATYSLSEFIYKGDMADDTATAGIYMMNRGLQSKAFDCTYTGTAISIIDFYKSIVAGSNIGTILAHSLNYYDGNEYEGASFGTIGTYGALVRSETLVMTDGIITAAYGSVPETLKKQTPPIPPAPTWTGEYHADFISQYPDRGGFVYNASAPHTSGYYVVSAKSKYDFHVNASTAKGLIVASKDPFDAITKITYDTYKILPLEVSDALDNITYANYDYRVMQPYKVTDINNNSSVFDFSPLGLLRATAIIGKGNEGDYKGAGAGFYNLYEPSTKLEYDFFSFVNNADPVWVKTIKRLHHYQDGVNDDTIVSVEYSDGFGRLLQTRTQAEDTIFGENAEARLLGSSNLPAQQGTNANALGIERSGEAELNVVVSGWQMYNNKGKVVEKYEPFFDTGFDYATPLEEQGGQKIKMYYDPRGQVIRTVNPDSTEQRVIYGTPVTLSAAEGSIPTPWETYSYDANDLDATSPHFATPKSAEVDALGRTIKTQDRLESSHSISNNVQMLYEYDIRGNLLNVKDAYDRTVFEHVYDLQTPAKEGESIPPLRTTHINKGTSTVVFDCTGKPIETRDAKGALTLHGYDVLQRPIKMWCRDNNNEAVTLRQNSVFGISVDDNNNGKLLEHYDESGYEKIDNYDFKGNVLQKSKQVINNNEILNAIQNSQNNGWNTIECYRVDWTGLNTAILSSSVYQTNMEYDGLNRLKKITYPADANNNRKELIPLYNKAGALQKVQFDGTEYVKEIAYNAKGQRLLIAYGNGLMTRYCYNEQTFRLTRLKTEGYSYNQTGNQHQYNYNAGTVKQDFAYTYDKGGNIISINDVTPQCGKTGSDELNRSFEYDALYRLLSATGRENQASIDFPRWDDTSRSDDPRNTQEYTQTYSYDLMGNINQLQHQGINNFTRTFTYVDSNLLKDIEVSGNTYTFEYDVCGNQVRENQERQFQWDYADRLKLYYNQVNPGQEPSTYTHYLYDAGGNRVKKLTRTQGGNWECITYIDGLIEYREDHNGQQQSISHIMDDSKKIASVRNGFDFGDSTPAIKYNMDDHLGSSNLSVDENGTLVNREEYYPFGETSFGSYSKKRYRFCGKEKEEESGLYYYGARYYSPWTCRFISVDPQAGKYIFQTPYAYADNNPICKMDYNGEGTNGGGPARPAPQLPATGAGRAPSLNPQGPAGGRNNNGNGNGGTRPVEPSNPNLRPPRPIDYLEFDNNGHAYFNPPAPLPLEHVDPDPKIIKAAIKYLESSPEEKAKVIAQIQKQNEKKKDNTSQAKSVPNFPKQYVLLYRAGPDNPATYTPRPGIDDDLTNPKRGLSVYASKEEAMKKSPGSKIQVIDATQLAMYGLKVDEVDGHLAIVPMNIEELKVWASTRPSLVNKGFLDITKEKMHKFTVILKMLRLGGYDAKGNPTQ